MSPREWKDRLWEYEYVPAEPEQHQDMTEAWLLSIFVVVVVILVAIVLYIALHGGMG